MDEQMIGDMKGIITRKEGGWERMKYRRIRKEGGKKEERKQQRMEGDRSKQGIFYEMFQDNLTHRLDFCREKRVNLQRTQPTNSFSNQSID